MARCTYTIRDNWGVEQCEDDAEPDSDYCTRHNTDADSAIDDYNYDNRRDTALDDHKN